MAVRKPPNRPMQVAWKNALDREIMSLDIQVVTPLFGGSAISGQVDRNRPVNAKTIRGHLRFWWRACIGVGYDTPKDLFEHEEKIWGSIDKPSAVDVIISTDEQSIVTKSSRCLSDISPKSALQYVTFPFRETIPDMIESTEFRLYLKKSSGYLDEMLPEIELTVWAWLTFGGIGARTRRGFGALSCINEQYLPKEPLFEWINLKKTSLHSRSLNLELQGVPSLSGATLIYGKPMEPMKAWVYTVDILRRFRQGGKFARIDNDMGKSMWPEADTIRQSHVNKQVNASITPAFPRADLGLPIIFEFYTDHGDTPKHILQGSMPKMTRMASPIILKPISINNQKAAPAILILNTVHPWEIKDAAYELAMGQQKYSVPSTDINAGHGGIKPMQSLNSARESFLAYAKNQLSDFREVDF